MKERATSGRRQVVHATSAWGTSADGGNCFEESSNFGTDIRGAEVIKQRRAVHSLQTRMLLETEDVERRFNEQNLLN